MTGPHTFFITAPVFGEFITCFDLFFDVVLSSITPLAGAPPAAQAAQLIIAMSGEVRAKREVAHIFVPAVGRKVIDLGNNVERGWWRFIDLYIGVLTSHSKGPTMKLIGNSLILGTVELISEALTLASKSEVGAENVGLFLPLVEEVLIV